MAEEEKQNQQEQQKEQEEPKKSKAGTLQWAIIAVVVLLCAGSGFFIGRFFKGSSLPASAGASDEDAAANAGHKPDEPETDKTWFYNDLDAVVANLNDPGVMRYVRAWLTLEISASISEAEAKELFLAKGPILTNWLTIYLASLGLEDIRGDRNLKRIQAQILDAFNDQLFPNQKPKIKRILFKEFAIQ